MQLELFMGVTVGLFLVYLFIGYFVSHKNVTSVDYLLAGKSLGIPAVTATLLAAQIGGGMFLGTAQNPVHGLFYIIGVALGLLLLGLGLAEKMRGFEVSTVGEIFEKTYRSPALHQVGTFLSIISLLGILVGQALAAKSVLLTFADIQSELFFVCFWLGIVAYTAIGGLRTVIITDFFRIIFIILTFSGICLYGILTDPLPFFSQASFSRLTEVFSEMPISWVEALRIMLIPAAFCLIEQDLAQKFFSARTQRIAGISALYASLLLMLFAFVPFYFGVQGKLLHLHLAPGVSPLLPVLTLLTNKFFFTIALCGLLAAITSTADSLLCALSSLLTPACIKIFSVKPTVRLSRTIILITGSATLAVSYLFSQGIIDVLVNSYEISICALLVPFLAGLFLRDFRVQAAWAATISGLVLFLLFKVPAIPHLPATLDSFIALLRFYAPYATFITLLGSAIAYGIGFIFSPMGRANHQQ